MSKYRLRPAKQADENKIKDLIHRVGINPFGLNWEHFVVAETEEGRFIGCGQLKPHRDGSVELASLAVEEDFRGQGVARRIMQHLMEKAPRPLYLYCRAALGPMYEKFGFRVVRDGPLPPSFRRIRIMFRLAKLLTGTDQGLIMRLE